MYLLNIFNTLADIIIIWLLATSTNSEDYSHPLASLITISAAPYMARLYPTIVWAATFSIQNEVHHFQGSKPDQEAIRLVTLRDQTFESIMLSTVVLTLLYGGALTMEGIARSAAANEAFTTCQTRKRIILPFCIALMFSMAFYNGLFDDLLDGGKKWNKPLFVVMAVGMISLSASTLLTAIRFKNLDSGSEHRETLGRYFFSFQIFFILCSIPIFYLTYQIRRRTQHDRFMFSDLDSYVRIMFILALLTLEPFAHRMKLRERFYRIDAEAAAPVNGSVVTGTSQQQQPPSYEASRKMMNQPWSTVSEEDVKFNNRMPVVAST